MEKNRTQYSQPIGPVILTKIKKLGLLLQKDGIEFKSIYLFGSHAKGTAHANSDIDLCIIQPDKLSQHSEIERVKIMRFFSVLNFNVDLILTTENEIKTNFVSPILHEIRKFGVLVVGKKLLASKPRPKMISLRLKSFNK